MVEYDHGVHVAMLDPFCVFVFGEQLGEVITCENRRWKVITSPQQIRGMCCSYSDRTNKHTYQIGSRMAMARMASGSSCDTSLTGKGRQELTMA